MQIPPTSRRRRLGRRVVGKGVHPNESIAKVIAQISRPCVANELRSPKGMATFYSRFLPCMDAFLSLLYRLGEKNALRQRQRPRNVAFYKAEQNLEDRGGQLQHLNLDAFSSLSLWSTEAVIES